MSIEAYKIAIKLTLVENVSKGLAALAPQFTRANLSAKELEDRLARIGKLTLAGGALAGLGGVLLHGMGKTLDAARDLAKANADFETLNLSAHDMAEVRAKSAQMSHAVLGTTIAGNVRLIQDLHTAFGSLEHALPVAESFARYESGIAAAFGHHASDGLVNAAAKALEHRGARVTNDPKAFEDELAMMSQVQFLTKGQVSSKDFLAASKTGKMAYKLFDKDYLYGAFAGLMTMNGGDRAGTAAMTTFSSLVGGHMDGKAKDFFTRLGLYQEGASKHRLKVVTDAMHGMSPEERRAYIASMGGQQILSGGLKDEYVDLMRSPDKLAAVIAARVRSVYGKGLSDEQVARIVAQHTNRNTGDFLGDHILNAEKLRKDAAAFRRAMDFQQGYEHYLSSPDGAANALGAAFTNLKAVLGTQLLPTVTESTLKLAKFVDKVSDLFERNPWAAKVVMGIATFVGSALVLGGALLMTRAAFIGLSMLSPAKIFREIGSAIGWVAKIGGVAARLLPLLGRGVMLLGRALLMNPIGLIVAGIAAAAYLLYRNWAVVGPYVKKTWEIIKAVFYASMDWIKQKIEVVWGAIKPYWDKLTVIVSVASRVVGETFSSIYEHVTGWLGKLIKWIADSPVGRMIGWATDAAKGAANSLANVGREQLDKTYQWARKENQQHEQGNLAKAASRTGSPNIAVGNGRPIQVNTTLNLDGYRLASVVSQHQAREASRPATGGAGFDPIMSPMPVTLGGVR